MSKSDSKLTIRGKKNVHVTMAFARCLSLDRNREPPDSRSIQLSSILRRCQREKPKSCHVRESPGSRRGSAVEFSLEITAVRQL